MIDSEEEDHKISQKFFRESLSITQMADKASDWINMYLHIGRLVSISTHICHSTGQPMIYVYYKEGSFISPKLYQSKKGYRISYEFIENQRTAKYSWRNHHINIMPKMNQIVQKGYNIFSVNNLEGGKQHEKNVTIIWYTYETQNSSSSYKGLSSKKNISKQQKSQ